MFVLFQNDVIRDYVMMGETLCYCRLACLYASWTDDDDDDEQLPPHFYLLQKCKQAQQYFQGVLFVMYKSHFRDNHMFNQLI